MTYKYPGVYPSITDLSGVVATNAVTACAYVGEAEFGPINTPVLLSSLDDYTKNFGAIGSEYGYGGYSLAVASASISTHYYVRVVPIGDSSLPAEERINDAKWGALSVAVENSTIVPSASSGYFYEEIEAAKEARDSLLPSGLFRSDDYETAFMVVMNDPNNREIFVSISDSTINENKASGVLAPTVFTEESSAPNSTYVTVTVPASIADGINFGASIVVSRMSDERLNGTFKVTNWTVDGQQATITYIVNDIVTEVNDSEARIGRYPDSDQTTFSVDIIKKTGSVMQVVENYPYCTLYPSQDSFGNSIYLEDVINDISDYVQVFVNNNFADRDSSEIVIPAFVTESKLTGGQTGKWEDNNQKITDLNNGWEQFRDRSQVSVTLLMNSGYVQKTNVAYQSKMLEIAEYRRDCFCLFDVPMTDTKYDNVIDWRKNVQGFNSYRGGVFSPWVKTFDSLQGRSNFVMCPSAFIAKIIGNVDPWVAPAGLNRGILSSASTSPTGLSQYYNEVQGGILYADNQINCLVKNPASGYVVWGQRTLQAKPSALDRINVARTIIYIETILRDAAKWHLFENNTAYKRTQITMQFNSFLNTILSAGGIQAFKVICDTTNNTAIVIGNNQLAIDIIIAPTYTAEVIKMNTIITGADANVNVTTT